jgi:hypothetical protein
MAFYVVNVSIDAPDGYVTPNAQGEYREDLSVNDIESVAELVLENWLDLQNALPEQDEADDEEEQLTKIVMDWQLPGPAVSYQFVPLAGYVPATAIPLLLSHYRSMSADINTPPPQRG